MVKIGKIVNIPAHALYMCADGTFSTHKGKGACFRHGGLKSEKAVYARRKCFTPRLKSVNRQKDLFNNVEQLDAFTPQPEPKKKEIVVYDTPQTTPSVTENENEKRKKYTLAFLNKIKNLDFDFYRFKKEDFNFLIAPDRVSNGAFKGVQIYLNQDNLNRYIGKDVDDLMRNIAQQIIKRSEPALSTQELIYLALGIENEKPLRWDLSFIFSPKREKYTKAEFELLLKNFSNKDTNIESILQRAKNIAKFYAKKFDADKSFILKHITNNSFLKELSYRYREAHFFDNSNNRTKENIINKYLLFINDYFAKSNTILNFFEKISKANTLSDAIDIYKKDNQEITPLLKEIFFFDVIKVMFNLDLTFENTDISDRETIKTMLFYGVTKEEIKAELINQIKNRKLKNVVYDTPQTTPSVTEKKKKTEIYKKPEIVVYDTTPEDDRLKERKEYIVYILHKIKNNKVYRTDIINKLIAPLNLGRITYSHGGYYKRFLVLPNGTNLLGGNVEELLRNAALDLIPFNERKDYEKMATFEVINKILSLVTVTPQTTPSVTENEKQLDKEEKANLVYNIELSKIKSAENLFQNRSEKYSTRSVENIVNAVKNGTFRMENFDPITVWENKPGELLILSGHSRTEAFRQLYAAGYAKFGAIPAKIFRGTFEEAKEIALNSNTLATKERETDRAKYYRNLRKEKSQKEVIEEARKNEGDNYTRIIAYSYLNPQGRTFDFLKNIETASDASGENMKIIAKWIGTARMRFPVLTDQHENELFVWLVEKRAYGTAQGQISNERDFLEKIRIAIDKRTEFGVFDSEKPLNLLNTASASPTQQNYNEQVNTLKNEVIALEKQLKDTIVRLRANGGSETQIQKITEGVQVTLTRKRIALTDLIQNKNKYLDNVKNERGLFDSVSGLKGFRNSLKNSMLYI